MYGDRWRVISTLGKGGQGIVYEVEDTTGRVSVGDLGSRLRTVLHDLNSVTETPQFRITIPQSRLERDTQAFVNAIEEIIAQQQFPKGAQRTPARRCRRQRRGLLRTA